MAAKNSKYPNKKMSQIPAKDRFQKGYSQTSRPPAFSTHSTSTQNAENTIAQNYLAGSPRIRSARSSGHM